MSIRGEQQSSRHFMGTIATTQGRKLRRRFSHRAGLRMVALVEALKGFVALLAAYFIVRMIRHDVDFEEAAEHVLFFFHINPHHHLSRQFLEAAHKLSGTSIASIFGIAIAYAILRFLEGYGLWKQRAWAEWLAIVSGCLYIPFEIKNVVRRPNQLHWIVLAINIIVVLYIAWVRWDEMKAERELGVGG